MNFVDPTGLFEEIVEVPLAVIVVAGYGYYLIWNEISDWWNSAHWWETDSCERDDEEDDCGCWKILEKRYSWHQGDYIWYEFQQCLEECKQSKGL